MKPDDVPTRAEISDMLVAFEDAKNRHDNPAVAKTFTTLSMAIDSLYTALTALSDEKLKRQQAEHEFDCILEDLAACRAELEASRTDAERYRWLLDNSTRMSEPLFNAATLERADEHRISLIVSLRGPTPWATQDCFNAAIDQACKDKT